MENYDFPGRHSRMIGRDRRYWYLTHFADDHSLRLRITHTCDDPDEIAFEICVGEDSKFIPLRTSLVAPIEWLVDDDIPPDVVSGLPDVWRAEFAALVCACAQFTNIAMLAPALGALKRSVVGNSSSTSPPTASVQVGSGGSPLARTLAPALRGRSGPP